MDESSRATVQTLFDHPFINPTIPSNPDPPTPSSGENNKMQGE